MNLRLACIVVLLLLSLTLVSSADEVWPGRVVVEFTEDVNLSALQISDGVVSLNRVDFDQVSLAFEIYRAEQVFRNAKKPAESYLTDLSRWYILDFKANEEPEVLVNILRDIPGIEAVEVDRKNYQTFTPNDPYYNNCWFLTQIHADEAWNITKGSTDVVIAIVDSGIDTGHVDLKTEKWVNPGEDLNGNGIIEWIEWNGLDDDQNGFYDDFWGWDFYSNDNIPHPDDPSESHGTLCASCAAAATDNGEGVASPGFKTRLMALRSNMFVTNLASCIYYAADNGADILSNSWGSNSPSSVIIAAVNHCHDVGAMFITSAGNDDYWTPPWPAYPSLYDYTLSVGATTETDQLTSFSNYCTTPFDGVLDVSAPGQNIFSASTQGAYETWAGTSASCPITAGVAALVLSIDPTLTPSEVETLIMQGCDDYYPQNPSFQYGILGYGRINALKTLMQISHYLTLDSYTMTDLGNDDGRADPGETVELDFVIQNDPEAQTANNIMGTLVCEDEAVIVTSGAVSFGTIFPGEIGANASPLEFTVGDTDPHWTDFTLQLEDGEGNIQEIQFTLELGRPDILLVDDDGGEGFQSLYETSFDSLDIFVDVWTQIDAAITTDELQRYNLVVWLNGNSTATLDNDEQTALSSYLDAGKPLFFSSKSAGLDIGTTGFYTDYLHASFVSDNAGSVFYAKGTEVSPFVTAEDSVFFIGGSGAGNFASSDVISPVGGALEAMTYGTSTDVAAICYAGDYNLVYFGFPFETVTNTNNYMNRQTLLDNIITWLTTVGVKPVPEPDIPQEFALTSVYPNPFNPVANISYQIPAYSTVKLEVFDIGGRLVETLVDGTYPAGHYQATFDGNNLASGLYLAKISTSDKVQVAKMMLMK